MKAHLALSGADEQNEPYENLIACRHHFKAAECALAESKNVYTDAEDVRMLRKYERQFRMNGTNCERGKVMKVVIDGVHLQCVYYTGNVTKKCSVDFPF